MVLIWLLLALDGAHDRVGLEMEEDDKTMDGVKATELWSV
jgi:hypothetical protein